MIPKVDRRVVAPDEYPTYTSQGTPVMSDNQLEPCPGCSGEARVRDCSSTEFDEDFYVCCTKCGLRTQAKCFPHTAIETWNSQPYIAALKEEIAELGDVAKGCAKREAEALTRSKQTEPVGDDELARADLSRVAYARALEKMRNTLTAVHDGLEDEGDRVYLGSTNHAELIHEAWHLADALHWDEILEDTQPKTPLAEINLKLQAELAEASAAIASLKGNQHVG